MLRRLFRAKSQLEDINIMAWCAYFLRGEIIRSGTGSMDKTTRERFLQVVDNAKL